MFDGAYDLDLDFIDEIDTINDKLTIFCEKPFTNLNELVRLIGHADSLLRTKGLFLDHKDLEDIRNNLEELSGQEIVSIIIPVYRDSGQSEYNLSISYYRDSEDSEYEAEMELQYAWETELDDEDFGEQDFEE